MLPPRRRLVAAAAPAFLLLILLLANPAAAKDAAAKDAALAQAQAAEQAAALRFYKAVSAATAAFVKAQIEAPTGEDVAAPASAAAAGASKNATTTGPAPTTPKIPMDVPNPLALLSPNQTAELVLNMYPVGPAFLQKKPEAQQAAVRLRMEMGGATANLTASVKLEQAQRALAKNLAEGASRLKALKLDPTGKIAAEACPLLSAAAAASAAADSAERSACLMKAAAEAEAKLNGTADVMAWVKWQESRLNTNLIFFLNWAFGANNVTDGRIVAPVVVEMTGLPAAASAPLVAGPAGAGAGAPAPQKQKVVDVLLFQGGGALAAKTSAPPRGYDPEKHRLMDPTCAILAFWQVHHAAADKDLAAKVADLGRGKAAGSRWWNVASLKPPVALRRFDCAPFTWEDWATGKRE
jgi:hypothetical protein